MTWNSGKDTVQPGDLVQLVGLRHKYFLITMRPGGEFQTHRGVLRHDDIIGLRWGTQVFSHNGSPFFVLQPSLADVLLNLRRNTQILYPKDIGFILVTMGIGPGQRVMEAGTGSGAMTAALAWAVGPEGRVFSYERRPQMQRMAQNNLQRLGLDDRVVFHLGDIAEGFAESGMDAFFLDVPTPWEYIGQVRAALKPGGFFSALVPTFNQVEKLLRALREHHFAFIEMTELLLRYYKPVAHRIRPVDRMVAHTGFIIFARRIEPVENPAGRKLLAEQGLTDETKAAAD